MSETLGFKGAWAVGLAFAGGALFAATTTTSIPVSAKVSQACSISTVGGGIAFGTYDPIGTNATAALYANGSVTVTCSKGSTGVTIAMDSGKQPLADQRQMKGATGTTPLKYGIFQPASTVPGSICTVPGTVAWTSSGPGLFTLVIAPTKDARIYNVCGVIPGGQDVTVEAYSDIVTATLNF